MPYFSLLYLLQPTGLNNRIYDIETDGSPYSVFRLLQILKKCVIDEQMDPSFMSLDKTTKGILNLVVVANFIFHYRNT